MTKRKPKTTPKNMRQSVKDKLKEVRKWYKYGEIKATAEDHNISPARAWEIARGRLNPRDNELNFVNSLLDIVLTRRDKLDRLNKV